MKTKDLVKYCGNISEAARFVGVTRQTIYNWLEEGNVPRHLAGTIWVDSDFEIPQKYWKEEE